MNECNAWPTAAVLIAFLGVVAIVLILLARKDRS